MRDERGTITLWMLGLCLMLLLLGGISLDLWRAFSERRALAGAADAAALAGATAIDEARFRATGEVRLEPSVAERRAGESLRDQADVAAMERYRVVATEETVVVQLWGRVDFTLLHLADPGDPLEINLAATAQPARSP